MRLSPGRIIFMLETSLLSFPLGLLCIYSGTSGLVISGFMVLEAIDRGPSASLYGFGFVLMIMSVSSVFAVVPLWRLSYACLRRGPESLMHVRGAWWRLMMIGVAAALLAAMVFFGIMAGLWSGDWFDSQGMLQGMSGIFALGAPLTLPAMHLWFARRRSIALLDHQAAVH